MIISGGIDLSVGSLMSLVNVISAKYMLDEPADAHETVSFAKALADLAPAASSASPSRARSTGLIIQVTRVADIVVTLAMLFVWAGVALSVLEVPGRRRADSSTRTSASADTADAVDPDRRS